MSRNDFQPEVYRCPSCCARKGEEHLPTCRRIPDPPEESEADAEERLSLESMFFLPSDENGGDELTVDEP